MLMPKQYSMPYAKVDCGVINMIGIAKCSLGKCIDSFTVLDSLFRRYTYVRVRRL